MIVRKPMGVCVCVCATSRVAWRACASLSATVVLSALAKKHLQLCSSKNSGSSSIGLLSLRDHSVAFPFSVNTSLRSLVGAPSIARPQPSTSGGVMQHPSLDIAGLNAIVADTDATNTSTNTSSFCAVGNTLAAAIAALPDPRKRRGCSISARGC